MFRSGSILSRIILLHVVAILITAVCIPIVLYWFLNSDVENLQRHALKSHAVALARHLAPRSDGGWSLDLPPSLRDQYSAAYGRYAYAVLDEGGHVLFSSRKDGARIFPVDEGSPELKFLEIRRGEGVISGASLRKRLAGREVSIQVAEDLAHRDVLVDDIVGNFFQQVGWITVPILLLLLATDVAIFRRAVRPLLRASDQAAHISPTRIDVRLPVEGIPKEIQPLVTAVNQALDRLEHGFRRQHEFTADAAHELRTPLAILRTRIDTLPDRTAAETLYRDVEGMSRVVAQLLDAAELETLVLDPDERADLRAVSAEVAEFVAPLALAQHKAIALGGTEHAVWIKGNAEILRRAIRNLVENALHHTPKGTDIEIAVEELGHRQRARPRRGGAGGQA